MDIILQQLGQGLWLAVVYWWTWLPVVLGVVAYQSYFGYQRAKFIAGVEWVMLEIIPPPEVPLSSPRAAEYFFAGLHASYSGGTNWKGQFFQGKVPTWFSFELVSNGGETHFYIRCAKDQRNVVEQLLFAQYPEAELRVVPDYVDTIPDKPDLSQYDIAGAELLFSKEPAYPIKTYLEFEEAGGKDEYARIDPIAPLMEILSALQPGEQLGVQYIIRATGGDWAKEGQKVTDKLKGKKEEKAKPPLAGAFKAIDALVGMAAEEKKEEKKDEFNLQKLTAAERKVLELVEFKLAKLAFKSTVRVLYVAPKDRFNGSRIASVTGMFKQLYYNNLNTFKPGAGTKDKGKLPWMFPSEKGFGADAATVKKKFKMVGAYKKRTFSAPPNDPKSFAVVLNTEELATLWHLPGLNVKAPLMPRVQAKKGQPPAILPTRNLEPRT